MIESNKNISQYIFIGSIGASLGKIFFEIFSDLKIPFFNAMDNVGEIKSGGGQNPVRPEGGPQGGNPPFNIREGKYNVSDPTGMSNRGYINRRTGRPFPTSQPYLRNILAVLEHEINVQNRTIVSLQNTGWSNVEWRYISEYMQFNYPDRQPHQWWNSGPVREALKRAT